MMALCHPILMSVNWYKFVLIFIFNENLKDQLKASLSSKVRMAQVNTAKVTITPLRISTMTVTGHIGTKIDIPKLWAAIPIMPY